MSVFDLLKNRGLDWITFVLPCLIQKLVLVLDKICSKGQDKNKNFCLSLRQLFVHGSTIKNTKIPILFLKIKNIIFLSFTDAILFCPVLACFVLYCSVQYLPFCKSNEPKEFKR
jgi:hypothetical protein